MPPLCAFLWALLALLSTKAAAVKNGGGIRGIRTLVSDWHIM